MFKKDNTLFIVLGGFFIANALIAEFIGVKIFSLEKVIGMEPVNMTLLGVEKLGFNLTAGVLLWPVVFVMTDVINEYFGKKGVKLLSYLAAGLIAYSFLMIFMSIGLEPADFWPTSHISSPSDPVQEKVADYDAAFGLVFGQGLWIIIASLTAFLIGQFVDVFAFHKIKSYTGEGKIWLRTTGSTLVSQFFDSFIVLFIAFYIGADWPIVQVIAIGLVNYMYKFIVAVALTPAIYGAHYVIDRYLGEKLATQLKEKAALPA